MSVQIGNAAYSYELVACALHWIVALLILALFGLGLYMSCLGVENEAEVAHAFSVFSTLKTLGLLVLTLAVLRIAWAFAQRHPQPLDSYKQIEVRVALVVHWMLYVSISI